MIRFTFFLSSDDRRMLAELAAHHRRSLGSMLRWLIVEAYNLLVKEQ